MNNQRLTAALELIGILAERFPAAFAIKPSHRRPLKLGIHNDILAQLSDTIAPRDLSIALRIYVGNIGYLKALVPGADRVDLNGVPAGTVTAEHAAIAKVQYEQRCAKRKQAVAKPVKPEEPPKPVAPPATQRRLGLADLRAAAKARQAVA
jgi:ProP effector